MIVQIGVYKEFVEFITSNPSLEDIAHFRLSEASEQRIRELLDKVGTQPLTQTEDDELNEFIRLEHLMRLAKLRARETLPYNCHHHASIAWRDGITHQNPTQAMEIG